MITQTICQLDDILPETGVCALVNSTQVAVFRTKDNRIFAIDNFDPFSQANVLSRGLIGGTTIRNDKGVDEDIIYVASPIYKQRFNLETGQCLDDDSVSLNSYGVRVAGDAVLLEVIVEEEILA